MPRTPDRFQLGPSVFLTCAAVRERHSRPHRVAQNAAGLRPHTGRGALPTGDHYIEQPVVTAVCVTREPRVPSQALADLGSSDSELASLRSRSPKLIALVSSDPPVSQRDHNGTFARRVHPITVQQSSNTLWPKGRALKPCHRRRISFL